MKIIYENKFYKLRELKIRIKGASHSHYQLYEVNLTNKRKKKLIREFECGYCCGSSDDLVSVYGSQFNDEIKEIVETLKPICRVSKSPFSLIPEYFVYAEESDQIKKLECLYRVYCELCKMSGYDDYMFTSIIFDYN